MIGGNSNADGPTGAVLPRSIFRNMFSRSIVQPFAWFLVLTTSLFAQSRPDDAPGVHPLDLRFHRQAVRRFVFAQEISLGGLFPGQIFGFDRTNPVFETPEKLPCRFVERGDALEIQPADGDQSGDAAAWVSGINPYATYIADVRSLPAGSQLRMEFGPLPRTFAKNEAPPPDKVEVIVQPDAPSFLTIRIVKAGNIAREHAFPNEKRVAAPFELFVQLYGENLGVFARKDAHLVYLGSLEADQPFSDVIDFRKRETIARSAFSLGATVPPGRTIVLGNVRSSLSSGIGQADIRMISYEDGSPIIENNRLWFTFSCRGLGTGDACQGVMSIDPSVFDPRFEGVIVFDRGDGLLRNDYASHVFYDRPAKEWRAISSCFSGGGRGPTGLAVSRSPHDPRRGFSVMASMQLPRENLPVQCEDPSLLWDESAKKWRLLVTAFTDAGFRTRLFESTNWSGPFKDVARDDKYDSTGTQIVKIGSKRYVFSGCDRIPGEDSGGVIAFGYPDLKFLGIVKFDLGAEAFGGRVWPNIFRLPPGFPARYMAIPMDRMNVPDIRKRNWSYGALYLFQADF